MPTIQTQTPPPKSCPAPEELRALLSSDVSGDRLLQLTDHVGECVHCRGEMDRYATHELPVLEEAVRDIDKQEIPKESAYWGVVDEAVVNLTRTRSTDASPTARLDPDLKFLQASETPGRLGRIGEFDILRLIGRGGMGVVLHAYDPTLQRDVAIKILDPQLASNDIARQRFLREARAAAAVAHDNIVAVHSVNEDAHSGLPFFVMQLVAGESLEQRLRRLSRLSVAETAAIGAQAAAGLSAAHATGLIHRDIKPGNILIEAGTDRVKLTDFGLARATEDLKLTKTGFVSGTPLYMAPEQAKGEEVDHRADLFSLGVVLYECLAGKPPFDGKTPLAVLRRVADDPHVALSELNPDVPDWFETIIDELLAKSPKYRIATAAELHDQLVTFAPAAALNCDSSKISEPCPLVMPSSLSRRELRRWKSRFALLMAIPLLVGILIGVGTMAVFSGKPEPAVVTVPGEPVTHTYAEEPVSPFLQNFPNQSGAVWSIAMSGDGKTLLMGLENGHVLVYDIPTGNLVLRLMEHKGSVFGLDFFPDDKRFVSVGDDGVILVWSLEDLSKPQFRMTSANGVRSVVVDRQGKYIATGNRGGAVTVWDVNTQVPAHEFYQDGSVHGLAFSNDPKGQLLISTGSNGVIKIWDLAGDREKTSLTGHQGPVYTVSFSRDYKMFATAGWDGTIRVWSTSNFQPLKTLEGHRYDVFSVAFSPCCKILASAGQDGTVRIWDVESGKELKRFLAHKPVANVVRFAADAKTIFSGGRDGDVRTWAGAKKEAAQQD